MIVTSGSKAQTTCIYAKADTQQYKYLHINLTFNKITMLI